MKMKNVVIVAGLGLVGALVVKKVIDRKKAKIDEVLGEGFEFVSMARALVNNPAFVNKIKEKMVEDTYSR